LVALAVEDLGSLFVEVAGSQSAAVVDTLSVVVAGSRSAVEESLSVEAEMAVVVGSRWVERLAERGVECLMAAVVEVAELAVN